MTEKMKKPYGMHGHAGFEGEPIEQESAKKKRRRSKARFPHPRPQTRRFPVGQECVLLD